jgi:integrating conjugative element membrane protein (TIGR03747 family)
MAEPARDPRRREVQRGLISRTLTALGQAISWLFLALLFSIVTEWAGMRFWWPEQGLAHSQAMLETEIGYLGTDLRRSLVSADPAKLANRVADKTHHVLFERTGLVDLLARIEAQPAPTAQALTAGLYELLRPALQYVIAAMQVTQLFAVRLVILTLATPVFGLFSLVALVDGFVQRDLRRWGGGRESSFVYHWAKRSAVPLLVLSWVIYLALPFSLHPSFVVLPFAAMFALSVAVTASTFKKYI